MSFRSSSVPDGPKVNSQQNGEHDARSCERQVLVGVGRRVAERRSCREEQGQREGRADEDLVGGEKAHAKRVANQLRLLAGPRGARGTCVETRSYQPPGLAGALPGAGAIGGVAGAAALPVAGLSPSGFFSGQPARETNETASTEKATGVFMRRSIAYVAARRQRVRGDPCI
jgi:hypothetical protein